MCSIDWGTWLHQPGMPPVTNSYDTSLATAAYDLAVKWHTADVMGIGAPPPAGAGPQDIAGWSSAQVGQLGGRQSLPLQQLATCEAESSFSKITNVYASASVWVIILHFSKCNAPGAVLCRFVTEGKVPTWLCLSYTRIFAIIAQEERCQGLWLYTWLSCQR